MIPLLRCFTRTCSAGKDIITRLLDKREWTRLGSKSGASEVKQHKWFAKINWGLLRNTQPPVSFPILFIPCSTNLVCSRTHGLPCACAGHALVSNRVRMMGRAPSAEFRLFRGNAPRCWTGWLRGNRERRLIALRSFGWHGSARAVLGGDVGDLPSGNFELSNTEDPSDPRKPIAIVSLTTRSLSPSGMLRGRSYAN